VINASGPLPNIGHTIPRHRSGATAASASLVGQDRFGRSNIDDLRIGTGKGREQFLQAIDLAALSGGCSINSIPRRSKRLRTGASRI